MPQLQWDYKDGEWEAWKAAIRDAAYPKFLYDCHRGHMLESPIELDQTEINSRCTKCSEGVM